jgi:hypothetical protein
MERSVSRSTSDRRGLAALALLAALAAGCEDGRCIRHSDCAPTLSCLATMCVIPPSDADTGVADTAVVDTAVVDTAVADTPVADTPVADTPVADTAMVDVGTDAGPAADAAMDAPVDAPEDAASDVADAE